MPSRRTGENAVKPQISAVVFDLGGVLIDWNPRYLFSKLIEDATEREFFLTTVCTPAWNEEQDAGRTFAEGISLLVKQFPRYASLIRAYDERWAEMLGGPIQPTVDLLEELWTADVPLYALSNWSAEKFPLAQARFPFLARFRGLVISGQERVKKPDPAMFAVLMQLYALEPCRTLFVDDNPPNVDVAVRLGFHANLFRGAGELRELLVRHSLLMVG